MKLRQIHKIVSQKYTSEFSTEDVKERLVSNFNLNTKRKFRDILKKEDSQYEGELTENSFKIKQNSSTRSINDGVYFFFTQINGEISIRETKTIISLNGVISEPIIALVGFSTIIYIVLWLTGILNIEMALLCILFMLGVFLYGRIQVKNDFERFGIEFANKLKIKTSH